MTPPGPMPDEAARDRAAAAWLTQTQQELLAPAHALRERAAAHREQEPRPTAAPQHVDRGGALADGHAGDLDEDRVARELEAPADLREKREAREERDVVARSRRHDRLGVDNRK